MAPEKTTAAAATAKPSAPAKSLAELFRLDMVQDEEHADVGLPPQRASVTRTDNGKERAATDLTGLAKLWLLIGPGGAGKTLLARWLAEMLAAHPEQGGSLLAALDPTNRTLGAFFDGVTQPPSAKPNETSEWLRKLVRFVIAQRAGGVVDFGGGDTTLAAMIDAAPTFHTALEEAGVAPIATYLLTPRIDDLATLASFEERGFHPRGVALVLNLGRAETAGAFDAVRRHPAYRAALDRGAVELWLPRLDPLDLALEIERKRLLFQQARDGIVPESRKVQPIGGIERAMVREWLERMDTDFAGRIPSWLPWR